MCVSISFGSGGGSGGGILARAEDLFMRAAAQTASQSAKPAVGAQAAKTPDEAKRRKAAEALAMGPAAGLAGNTLLTGAGGIQPGLLNIGKNNLLGA